MWNDYRFSFDFNITNSCIGVIIRGRSLTNYAMLQIKFDMIRPHIRSIMGWCWKPFESLLLKQKLSSRHWYKCLILCKTNKINIQIFDNKKEIFTGDWELPFPETFYEFYFHEFLYNNLPKGVPKKRYFPINLEYGSIGFRNWNGESALVRNILISKI